MAAKAARKAKADAIKVTKLAIANVANFEHEADPTIKVMLQGLDKNLERQIAKLANGERGLDVFIGSKEYDEFVAAVRYCNGLQTTSKQFFIRPVLILMRRFGIKEVEEGIEKIKKSPEPRKRDLGRTLESQLITEKEIIKAKKIKETI
ncbi:unnamed protein product [Hyaloperonospora brassicae]|uniref:Uncharacterized protein n=1 Tax=Hyaloperonospora brassicae TaxID=162125 RepID=A0AAV0TIW1_HYABA|nr:unnamed protein product [Hyaloperonospora brassicae]